MLIWQAHFESTFAFQLYLAYCLHNQRIDVNQNNKITNCSVRECPTRFFQTFVFLSLQPIIAEDYSDPKDVVRVAQQGGLVIPPESPDQIARPPEDDYSVPYDAQKVIERKSRIYIYANYSG